MGEHIAVRINSGLISFTVRLGICQSLSVSRKDTSSYDTVLCLILPAVVRTADNIISLPDIKIAHINDKGNKNQHKEITDNGILPVFPPFCFFSFFLLQLLFSSELFLIFFLFAVQIPHPHLLLKYTVPG